MVPIFNSYSNIINLYSEVVEIFDNNMKDMPVVATDTLVDRYRALKPKIDAFTDSIKDVTIRNHIIENLKKIYIPF